MSIKKRNLRLAGAVQGALIAAGMGSMPAQSMEFEKNGWLLNFDTTFGYSAQWRAESRDELLEANVNGNDGNNAFDSGSMTSSKANVILEFGAEKGNWVFFARADAMYDYVYADGTSDMSRENYLTFNSAIPLGGSVERGDFPRETIEENGRRMRLLDLFGIYNFELGEQYGSIKAGRQIISWGGSLFYPGINGLQNPNDAAAALAPGVETKEIFLPTSAIDLKMDFTSNLSGEVYYKFSWEETLQAGVGSYLSTSDTNGPGAYQQLLPEPIGSIPVGRKIKPEDDDQWGVAGRYITDQGTSFELAYAESHANIPGVRVYIDFAPLYPVPIPPGPQVGSAFQEVYLEDIKSWNFNVTGTIVEAEVYVDFFYSENAPFLDTTGEMYFDDTPLGYLPIGQLGSDMTRGHYWQVTAGMSDVYSALTWLSPSVAFNFEMIYQGNNLGTGDLADNPYLVTDTAWGYQFAITPRYFNIINGLDGRATLTFRHDVDGYGNSFVLGNGLKEDQKRAGLSFTADYLSNWEFKASYAWYFDENEKAENTLIDRDNFSLSVKYRF